VVARQHLVFGTCHVYTAGDTFPLEVRYEVLEEPMVGLRVDARRIQPRSTHDSPVSGKYFEPPPTVVFWSQADASQAINLSCDPSTLTTIDPDELSTCSDFPTEPFRITNFSQNGVDGRTFSIEGTPINISCSFPEE